MVVAIKKYYKKQKNKKIFRDNNNLGRGGNILE